MAQRSKNEGESLILGLEESCLSNMDRPQGIINELAGIPERLKRSGLDDVFFERGSGDELALKIQKRQREKNSKFSNIVILGGGLIFKSDEFNKLRGKRPDDKALLVCVDTTHLRHASGIRLVEMYLLALSLNAGRSPLDLDDEFIRIITEPNGKKREYIFIPIEPYDTEELRRINDLHAKAIRRMA